MSLLLPSNCAVRLQSGTKIAHAVHPDSVVHYYYTIITFLSVKVKRNSFDIIVFSGFLCKIPFPTIIVLRLLLRIVRESQGDMVLSPCGCGSLSFKRHWLDKHCGAL